ncbi:mediator of DNA damage checkpoint protein 1 isoform X2 [Halichoeres trimaculatus]|uniref:mediator of DNA damage checkpoint protein 1 isoform X2 n=1 Tax=Halichoeres trimaculatus TaxID=147232 RepID=UPI003D9E7F14
MDATQIISDSILESEDEESEEEIEKKRGRPMAKLCILKNQHLPESELPLFLGDNVLGRDPSISTLPLQAPSVSKQHATICISAYKRKGCDSTVDIEALIWDHGSMNGTRKGRLKLTPNVRYALSEQDNLVVADIPCKYMSYVVDEVSSQGDTKTQARKNNGVKPRFLDVSEEKSSDASVNSNDGEMGVSLPEDMRDTPVRHSCLSLEQTPVQPQPSLVPESDSDSGSDGEGGGAGGRKRKALASSSDSHKPSPICSTFLSPANKVVLDSVDESPLTPSSANKNRTFKHVSFSTEEKDMDVRRQQPKEKKALEFMEDSEDEGETEEESNVSAEKKSAESGKQEPVQQDNNNSLKRQDKLPVFAPEVVTNAIPEFNMDSDTDVEGEEEGVTSASPVALHGNQKSDQPADTAQFHMDSDTDVDEDNDALDNVTKYIPPCADTKPPHVISVVQPEDITVDSDTDVDDDDNEMSDAATKAKPVLFQSPQTADSAQSTQQKQFHLDSDTDVDEEEQGCEANTTDSKTDRTSSLLEIKPSGPDSARATSHSTYLGSDTDDETTLPPAVSDPLAPSIVKESPTTADQGADVGILSDSDTDVEAEPHLVIPTTLTPLSVTPDTKAEASQLNANADTLADESRAPPAGVRVNPADCTTDSDEKGDFEEAGEDQIPSLCRENTPGFLAPPLQNCSTPVQVSGKIEDMDTQAFLSPSSGPHRSAAAGGLKTLTSLSDSYEDEDFIVAETQSFVLQTREDQSAPPENPSQAFVLDSSGDEKGERSIRGGSFQLGLSDSSHLQGQAQALAMESTQAFVSVDGGVSQEQTQAYEVNFNTDTASLEATQVYGQDEEDGKGSVMSEKGGDVNFALEATQAYISEPRCDSNEESDEDDRKSTASAETQPLDFATSSTLAMAETQPLTAFNGESLGEEDNVSTIEVKSELQRKTKDGGQHVEAIQPQEMQLSRALIEAETQPICTGDNEESDDDDEDSVITSRKRKAKPLELSDEQTQPLTNPELSALETQPMEAAGDEESDEEDFIPGPRKRTAKKLHIQDEESQTLTNSELSETQPVATGQDGEDDEEDSMPHLRKRKAKPLQSEEDDTQPIMGSEALTVVTQPMKTNPPQQSQGEKGKQSDAETSGTRVRNIRGTRVEYKQEECSEPPLRQTRGKTKALPTTRGRRGRSRLDESEEEEEVEQGKKTRGQKLTRKDKEEEERLKREETERLKEERRKEQEEKERADNAQKEKEIQLERERVEKMEKDRLDQEKADEDERKRLEKEKKEEEERKEQEERERSEAVRRGLEERLERERNEQERERLEKEAKEKQIKEQQESNENVNKIEPLSRGRRGTRRTMAAPPPAQDLNVSIDDDVPARRTRSRSNSSNSVSSERSSSSISMQTNRGRGQGRGAKRSTEPPAAAPVRSSNRRRTVAAGPTQQDYDDVSPQGVLSRSSSTHTLNSDVSSSSLQSRGRGGRQRGRGRKSEDVSLPSMIQSDQSSAPKPAARGRKGKKAEESLNEVSEEDNKKANSQQASATRGRQQAAASTAAEEGPSNQKSAKGDEAPVPVRNVRGQRKVKSEPVEAQETPSVTDGNESNRKGRKRELEANKEEPSRSSKVSKGKEKAQTKKAEEEEAKGKAKDETPVKPNKRGRASTAQTKNSPTELETKEEKVVEEPVRSKGRGRSSAVQNKKSEELGGRSSVDAEASEPQTPTSSASRKRQASSGSTPVAKTPRSSSASPAAGGRLRAASQTYQVLFTGVMDEAGEKVLARLGGCMAKGVADMNCLVTDKVRRTVKFLCAVAKGVPIVNTHWLEKSGKAGSFLAPNAFVVKDPEQEKKFNFCLQESLRIAACQPLLQGYEIHVTKSVKPEPPHMKDIISCSGATFLPKMPSSHKPQTVVISCEEDLSLCRPAFTASLPVVTAEFILTGILQQKLDLQAHSLSAPAQAGGGRGKGRKMS